MADRYTLYEIENLRDRFTLADGVPVGVKKSYNISPTQTIPVITSSDGANHMHRMKWGFVPANAKDLNSVCRYKTHRANSEGIFHKATWQESIRTKRCLIPANGFYEWKKTDDGKRAFYIRAADQPLFAFAGLYGDWTDPEGKQWGVCAIITTATGSETDMLPSRLPVIVDPADEADWLNPNISDVSTLIRIMRPYDPGQLVITRVGDDISSLKIDKPSLITPLFRQ
jgi:putative SOS response-associated peptidase YedK